MSLLNVFHVYASDNIQYHSYQGGLANPPKIDYLKNDSFSRSRNSSQFQIAFQISSTLVKYFVYVLYKFTTTTCFKESRKCYFEDVCVDYLLEQITEASSS